FHFKGNRMSSIRKNDDVEIKLPLLEQPSGGLATAEKKVRTAKFKIGDIKCTSCTTSIESVLKELAGVVNVAISVLDGNSAVTYMPDLTTVSNLVLLRFFFLSFRCCYVS
ncbi:hypothetical protein LINGRAHAP2_LOCUS21792, partial [Linum grandiflorum]